MCFFKLKKKFQDVFNYLAILFLKILLRAQKKSYFYIEMSLFPSVSIKNDAIYSRFSYRCEGHRGNQLVGVMVCDMVNKNNNIDRRESKSTRLKTEERMKLKKSGENYNCFFILSRMSTTN